MPHWSDEYIGIPFVENDQGSRKGTNCWGIVRLIYLEQRGILLPSYDGSYRGIRDFAGLDIVIHRAIAQLWKPIAVPKPFNIIVTKAGKDVSHIGVVIDHREFIHTRESVMSATMVRGSRREDYHSNRWLRRIEGFYELA